MTCHTTHQFSFALQAHERRCFDRPQTNKQNLAKAVFFVEHPNPKSPWAGWHLSKVTHE